MSDPMKEFGRFVWSEDLQGYIDSVGRYLGKFPEDQPPTLALEGQEYLDEDNQQFYKRAENSWVEMSSAYIGTFTQDTMPASAGIGKEIYLEDLGEFRKWNGETWVTVGVEGVAGGFQVTDRTGDFPTAPERHQIIYRTDKQRYYIWDSESELWYSLAHIPIYLGEFDGSFPSSTAGLPLLAGQECFRTDIGEFFKYSGNYWIEI